MKKRVRNPNPVLCGRIETVDTKIGVNINAPDAAPLLKTYKLKCPSISKQHYFKKNKMSVFI